MDNFDAVHTLILNDRKKLEMSGVKDIIGFSPEFVELSTVHGEIEIDGNNLKIEELCQNGGKVLITGEVNGIFYVKSKNQKIGWNKKIK